MVEKKSNNYGIVAAVILFVALIIGNYFQYQLSPLAPRLMETMGLTPGQVNLLILRQRRKSIWRSVRKNQGKWTIPCVHL